MPAGRQRCGMRRHKEPNMTGIPALFSICLLAAASTAAGASAPPARTDLKNLPPGRPLVAGDLFSSVDLKTRGGAARGVGVSGQPFRNALRLQTGSKEGRGARSVALRWTNSISVKKGDTLLAVFSARAVEPKGEGAEPFAGFMIQENGASSDQVALIAFAPESKWETIYLPARAKRDYKAGELQFRFLFDERLRTIEIGGIALLDLGPKVDVHSLPVTKIHYDGGGPDAPWRKEALARIEAIRKADLKILVRDAEGRPVPGAKVSVRMKRHAFGFGTELHERLLMRQNDSDAARYREAALKLYNKAVFGNATKWGPWEKSSEHQKRTERALKWLHQRGFAVRGHTLLWPGWKKQNPPDLPKLAKNQLRKRIDGHIRQIMGRFQGQLAEWDVINEPRANKDFMKVLGDEAMAEWFKLARKTDPKAKLYINDYSILTDTPGPQNAYAEIIRRLLEQGAPVDGIGFQSHFGTALPAPEKILAVMDRFAQFGCDLMVTEFDCDTLDEETQARFTRDFLTLAFSHPKMVSFMMWGFWENRHWRPNAAFFRPNWTLKPNGQAYMDLVLKEWWTNADGATDANGVFKTRGFLGEYEITVQTEKKKERVNATLAKETRDVRIALK